LASNDPTPIREFLYANGRVAESTPPHIPAPRGKRSKARLYVLANVDSNPASPTAKSLRKALTEAFYRDATGSLTSTLRRVIQGLNDQIYHENERSIRTERCYATIVCAAVRDDDVFLAAVGRALCYVVRPHACERLGRGDPHSGERPVDLLGQVEEIGVDLFHRSVSDLTALVLASSGVADLPSGELERALQEGPAIMAVRRLTQEHQGRRPFRALVVPISAAQLDTGVNGQVPPLPAAPASPRVDSPVRARRARFPLPERHVELAGSDDAEEPIPASTPRRRQPTRLADVTPDHRPPTSRPIGRPESPPVEPAEDVAEVQDLVQEFAAASRPRPPTIPRRIRRRRPRKVPWWLIRAVLYVALAVSLFAVGYFAVTLSARVIQNGQQYASAVSTLTQAEQTERQALEQNDPLVRRHLLDEANQLVGQALAGRPSSPAFVTAAARIGREYQEATGTIALPAPQRVVDLATPGDQLVLHGSSLYVLDRANSRIYLYLLNVDGTSTQASPSPILVRAGDHVGPITVGKLTQIAWMPVGGTRTTAALVALDHGGWLIQHEPVGGLSYLALADPSSWADVNAVAGYAGNLYALSTVHQSLVWLPPQPNGFDGPVYNYVEPSTTVDLSDASTFAIDGELFLAHVSGQVQSFTAGKVNDFAGAPADLAPQPAISLAVGRSALFLGDPKRSRIVQLSRQGEYQRALSDGVGPPVLAGMRDLAVADDGQAIYVLSGSTVYRFVLPVQP
jgi:hypothetical protein